MAVPKEGFFNSYITPFKQGKPDGFSIYDTRYRKPSWSSLVERNAQRPFDVVVQLTEMKENQDYQLSLRKTDRDRRVNEPFVSMDLKFDGNGNLTGLKEGTLTIYKRRGNRMYIFDYEVQEDNPSVAKILDVNESIMDGAENNVIFIDDRTKTELIVEENVPLSFDWLETAASYLSGGLPEGQTDVNGLLVNASMPVVA